MSTPLFPNAKMPNSTLQKNCSRRRNRRPVNKKSRGLIAVIVIAVLLGITWIGFALANETEVKISDTEEQAAAPVEEVSAEKKVGLTREEVSKLLHGMYDWNIKIVNPDSEIPELKTDSLIEDDLQAVLDDIFTKENENEFRVDLTPDETQLDKLVESAQKAWDVPAIAAELVGYDTENDELIFGKGIDGVAVDGEQLKKDIKDAVKNRELDKVISVKMDTVRTKATKASDSDYKIIGTFTTHSTANENRNTNLDLACQAINGTVLKPGEEFSFNLTTGNRTAEKGYKAAKAYRDNGVVVDEEGGGVCQVSSTLYNALVLAGIKVTERHAHTYEPSYVTPGEDAMVSYDGYNGPDLKFTNNTSSTVVLKAKYSDRTVTVSIIGIPILAPNEKVFMESRKTEEGQTPTEVIEDPAVEFGTTVVKSAGSPPTIWKTDIVKTVDGEEVSRENLHTSKYRGHKRVVHTNTITPPEEMPQDEGGSMEDGPAFENSQTDAGEAAGNDSESENNGEE